MLCTGDSAIQPRLRVARAGARADDPKLPRWTRQSWRLAVLRLGAELVFFGSRCAEESTLPAERSEGDECRLGSPECFVVLWRRPGLRGRACRARGRKTATLWTVQGRGRSVIGARGRKAIGRRGDEERVRTRPRGGGPLSTGDEGAGILGASKNGVHSHGKPPPAMLATHLSLQAYSDAKKSLPPE